VPLYEYKCEKCGHRFEKIEKHSASAVKKCPKCGANAPRQLSAPGIQFKGSGWYVTDYAGKSSSKGEGSGDGTVSKSETPEKAGNSDGKPGDSKGSSEKSSSKKEKK
jgi:putative FmdB family regulatory protein